MDQDTAMRDADQPSSSLEALEPTAAAESMRAIPTHSSNSNATIDHANASATHSSNPVPGSNGISREEELQEEGNYDSPTTSSTPSISSNGSSNLVGSTISSSGAANGGGGRGRRSLLPTGCCYDVRMKMHMNADFSPGTHHPEDPRRIHEIFKAFQKAGLVYTGPDADLPRILRDTPTRYMWRIPARTARRDEICLAHTEGHFDWVEGLDSLSTDKLRELTRRFDQGRESLYIGGMSHPVARLSVGGAIDTCKSVVAGVVKNAFAVIRPPGHHAEHDKAMGFCFFNNVPVAVKVCQREYPAACRRVLILDWDVHHGNGVQDIFYDDPNVLYISLHVYQNGAFYPGRPPNPEDPDGGPEHCGRGAGLGRNVNIGWHDQGMGDGEYMAAFQKIVMPIAHEFDPDLVVISAGFDAADGDELGGCFVTPACYAHMTHMLMSLAEGKVAVCLEGGYNLKAISNSAVAVARTLMGEPPPKLSSSSSGAGAGAGGGIPKINKEAARTLAKVQAYQAPYWECMRPGVVDVAGAAHPSLGGQRLHDVVRTAQRQVLQGKHGMVPLYVQRQHIYKSFENQVLVTPDLHAAKRLLVIIHDPPQLLAQPDVVDTSIHPHNAWVVDGVTRYIDWAVSNRFGVMDINVPSYVTQDPGNDPTDPYQAPPASHELQRQVTSLMCYLWDNYLQLYEASDIFLMGVGEAYLGIKVLLISRDCRARISGVVNFVTGSLKPVKSDVDTSLSGWYRDNSRVYLTGDHAAWLDPALVKKVQKRRFGTVVKSPAKAGLNGMMAMHAEEAQRWMMDRVTTMEDDEDEDETLGGVGGDGGGQGEGGDTTEDES